MGATNHGTQQITYDYYENMTSLIVNSRHVGSKLRGIYSGGYLTRVSDSEITISPMVVEIGDGTIQARIQTMVAATLNSTTLDSGAISSSTPYIVLRRAYLASVVNYMEIHAIASVAVAQANDIIVGKCVFSGAALTGFEYTERTFLNIQDLFLKVESTGVTEMYVQVRAGRVQNATGYVFIPEQKVGPFTAPSAPNSRVDLVYVNTGGTVAILRGTAAVSPSAPDYGGKLVIAQVRLVNGDTSIPTSSITDVRSFITSPLSSQGIAKASVNFVGRSSNGGCTINKSFNVSSVTRTTSGTYRVAFITQFSDVYYTFAGGARDTGGAGDLVVVGMYKEGIKTTSYIDLVLNESPEHANPTEICVVFFD